MDVRIQRCEACGAEFGCGADVGRCWCESVALDAAALARLRARFARCLCPSCLRTVAAGSLAEVTAAGEPARSGAGAASLPVIAVAPRPPR